MGEVKTIKQVCNENRKQLDEAGAKYFGKAGYNIAVILKHINGVYGIENCKNSDVFDIIRESLSYGVLPDGKSAYVTVYNKIPKLGLMRSGLVNIAIRDGIADEINFDAVRSGDKFEWEWVDGVLKHRHAVNIMNDDGEIVGAWCVVKKDGKIIAAEMLKKSDIAAIRAQSKADKDGGVWGKWEGEMVKKSAIRRAMKDLIQTSGLLANAVALDDEINFDFTAPTTNAGDVMGGKKPPKQQRQESPQEQVGEPINVTNDDGEETIDG